MKVTCRSMNSVSLLVDKCISLPIAAHVVLFILFSHVFFFYILMLLSFTVKAQGKELWKPVAVWVQLSTIKTGAIRLPCPLWGCFIQTEKYQLISVGFSQTDTINRFYHANIVNERQFDSSAPGTAVVKPEYSCTDFQENLVCFSVHVCVSVCVGINLWNRFWMNCGRMHSNNVSFSGLAVMWPQTN